MFHPRALGKLLMSLRPSTPAGPQAPLIGNPLAGRGWATHACVFERLEDRVLLSGSAYHLTFDDEFNALDLADKSGTDTGWMVRDYWYNPYHVDQWGNPQESHYYVDPQVETGYNPFSINNGVLTISAAPTPQGFDADGQPYVSGELTTTKGSVYSQTPNSLGWSQQYGYFEIRAQLPAGKGLWPAFWLIPEDGGWPPEYDIFEVLGHDPDTIWQTSHWDSGGHQAEGSQYPGVVDTSDGFHTYGFEWEADTIKWYVDGTLTETLTNRVFEPMYMLVNLGIGGWAEEPDGTTPWPAEMKIDYVRVYSKDASIPEVTPQSGYSVSPYMPTGNEPDAVDLAPVADAHVEEGFAGTNYASAPGLKVKDSTGTGDRETYLKFDISGIDSVDTALLRLSAGTTSTFDTAAVSVYGVSDTSWTESGIKWNNRPAPTTAALSTIDVTTGRDPVTQDNTTWWNTWDVTSYIQQEKAAGRNTVTLLVRADETIGPVINFRSKETAGTGSDPMLRIVEQSSSGGGGTIYGEDFNDGTADGLTPRAGTWSVNASNRYVGENLGGAGNRAISTINASGSLPADFDYNLVARTTNAGWQHAHVIFDYVDNNNFKYAGMFSGVDEWRIGQVVNGTKTDLVIISEAIATDVDYSLSLEVRGSSVTFKNSGVTKVSYTFGGTINDGLLGMGIENGQVIFDDITVTQVQAGTSYSENFNDGTADGLTAAAGTWSVNASNRYVGENLGGAGAWAVSAINAITTLPTDFDFSAVAQTIATSGWENAVLIFDYTNAQNFKFAGLFSGADEWRIGQVVSGTRTVLTSAAQTLAEDTDYALTLEVRGNTVTLKSSGVTKASYTFGGTINDGQLAVGVENGRAIFDDLNVSEVSSMMQSSSLAVGGFATYAEDEPATTDTPAATSNKKPKQDKQLLAYFASQSVNSDRFRTATSLVDDQDEEEQL